MGRIRVGPQTMNGMLDALAAVVDLANPSTKIIPGHGQTVDETAVLEHRNMIVAVRDRVAALIKQGKTWTRSWRRK